MRTAVAAYGVSVAAVAVAAAVAAAVAVAARRLLDPRLGGEALIPALLAAVLLAARYGGWGPGLAALVLGGLAALALAPPDDPASLVLYALVGLVALAVVESRRRPMQRLPDQDGSDPGPVAARLRATAERFRLAADAVNGFNGITLDLTARRQAEERLRAREEFLAAVFSGIEAAVTVSELQIRTRKGTRRLGSLASSHSLLSSVFGLIRVYPCSSVAILLMPRS